MLAECFGVCFYWRRFFFSSFARACNIIPHWKHIHAHTHTIIVQYIHTDTSLSFIISWGGIKKTTTFSFFSASRSFLLALKFFCCFSVHFANVVLYYFLFFFIILSALIFFCHSHSHHIYKLLQFFVFVSFSRCLFYCPYFVEGMFCCQEQEEEEKPNFSILICTYIQITLIERTDSIITGNPSRSSILTDHILFNMHLIHKNEGKKKQNNQTCIQTHSLSAKKFSFNENTFIYKRKILIHDLAESLYCLYVCVCVWIKLNKTKTSKTSQSSEKSIWLLIHNANENEFYIR